MEPLTHEEWDMLDDCTLASLIDNPIAWKQAMNKIHPKVPTIATCEHDCNECFNRCHGYYPGEPHHSGKNPLCPLTVEIKAFNETFAKNEDIETREEFVFGPEHCICKCVCTDDRHLTTNSA